MIVLYVFLKLVLYASICMLAVPMLKLNIKDKLSFGIQWGVIRILLGLVAGIFIVMAYAFSIKITSNEVVGYIFAFGFVRYFEWLILASLMSRKHKLDYGSQTQLWILIGVLSSMLMDYLVFELNILGNLKFVC